MTTLRLDPRRLQVASLRPPVSKSDGVRELVVRQICSQPLPAIGPDAPRDMRVMARALQSLASDGEASVDCEDAGSVWRLTLAQAAIREGKTTHFEGTTRLGERPIAGLLTALQQTLGPAGLEVRGTPWPIDVVGAGRAESPRFLLTDASSSQFATSLLFAAAALHLREGRPWRVDLPILVSSQGYLDLTIHWLRRAGFEVQRAANHVDITGWRAPLVGVTLPGDWSSAGYLLLIGWRVGVPVQGLDLAAPHPDRSILDHLQGVGLRLRDEASGIQFEGTPERGLDVDVSPSPDLALTLAALACVLPGESILRRTEVLKGKESDRQLGVIELVQAVGGRAELIGADLHLEAPRRPVSTFRFDARGDHRRALAAATLGVLLGAVVAVEHADAVEKSFPDFWKQLESGL